MLIFPLFFSKGVAESLRNGTGGQQRRGKISINLESSNPSPAHQPASLVLSASLVPSVVDSPHIYLFNTLEHLIFSGGREVR